MIFLRPVLHLCLLSVIAPLALVSAQEQSGVVPGSVLLASCEGLSTWDRAGQHGFARFFVPEVAPAGAKASVVAWADMIYDGHRLPSGNYLCSAHEWVREIAPDGAIVWEYRVQKPCELKTCVPLPNGSVMTVDADHGDWAFVGDTGADFSAVGPPDWLSVRRITSPIVVGVTLE